MNSEEQIRVEAALKVEELAMRLEAHLDDQRRIVGDLLQSMQDYVDLYTKPVKEAENKPGLHLFPESREHHLNSCWCEEAKTWREARDKAGR